MKYILSENNILKETFILAEKYQLVESIDWKKEQADMQTVYDHLVGALATQNKANDGAQEAKFKSTWDRCIKLSDELPDLQDPTKIKSNVETFTRELQVIAGDIKDARHKAKVLDDLRSLNTLAASSTIDKKAISQMRNTLSDISIIFDDIAQGTDRTSYEDNTAIKVTTKLVGALIKLAAIKDSGGDDEARIPSATWTAIKTDLGAIDANTSQLAGGEATAKLGTEGIANLLSTVISSCKSFNDKYGSQIQSACTTDEYSQAADAANTASKKDQDWQKLIDKADNKTAAYEEFLSTQYPDHVEFLKGLGRALRLDCEEYGFTAAANPFLYFLEQNVINKKNLDVTPASYAAMHDSVVRGLCSAKVLQVDVSTDPADKHIFYVNNFHNSNRSARDLVLLVQYYNTVTKNTHNDTATDDYFPFAAAGAPADGSDKLLDPETLGWLEAGKCVDKNGVTINSTSTSVRKNINLCNTILFSSTNGKYTDWIIRPNNIIVKLLNDICGIDAAKVSLLPWGSDATKAFVRAIFASVASGGDFVLTTTLRWLLFNLQAFDDVTTSKGHWKKSNIAGYVKKFKLDPIPKPEAVSAADSRAFKQLDKASTEYGQIDSSIADNYLEILIAILKKYSDIKHES